MSMERSQSSLEHIWLTELEFIANSRREAGRLFIETTDDPYEVQHIQPILNEIDKLYFDLKSFENKLPYRFIEAIKTDINSVLELIDSFTKEFKIQVEKLKLTATDDDCLLSETEKLNILLKKSILSSTGITNWMAEKLEKCQMLQEPMEKCMSTTMCHDDLRSVPRENRPLALRLIINNDKFRDDFVDRIRDSKSKQISGPCKVKKSSFWKDHYSQTQLFSHFKRFISFASVNGNRDDLLFEFEVTTLKADEISRLVLYEHRNDPQKAKTKMFELPGPPRQLQVTNQHSGKDILVKWNPPKQGSANVKSYRWTFESSSSADAKRLGFHDSRLPCQLRFSAVKDNSNVEFRVCCVTEIGEMSFVQWESLSQKIKKRAKVLRPGGQGNNITMFLPESKEEYKDENTKVRKVIIGKPLKGLSDWNRSILLVGATGAGKSTMINSIINHFYGVTYNDDFRFRAVEHEHLGHFSQKSVTKWITVYVIGRKYNDRNETLTIIDTPGFQDTECHDNEINRQIADFLLNMDLKLPEGLNAIGIVVKGSENRSTIWFANTLTRILALFGKTVEPNIFWLLTHCDSSTPDAIKTIREGDWPNKEFFIFSNAFLETGSENLMAMASWKCNVEQFDKFFEAMDRKNAASLHQTMEVIRQRENLETCHERLQEKLKERMKLSQVLTDRERNLKIAEANLSEGGETTVEDEQLQTVLTDHPESRYSLTCKKCKSNCHPACRDFFVRINWGTWFCSAIDFSGYCTVCDKQCFWKDHNLLPKTYERRWVPVKVKLSQYAREYGLDVNESRTGTTDQLSIYKSFLQQKEEAADVVSCASRDVVENEKELRNLMTKCLQIQRRLDEIALKPIVTDYTKYTEQLIKAEELQKSSGWQQRIAKLKDKLANSEDVVKAIDENKALMLEASTSQESHNNSKEKNSIIDMSHLCTKATRRVVSPQRVNCNTSHPLAGTAGRLHRKPCMDDGRALVSRTDRFYQTTVFRSDQFL